MVGRVIMKVIMREEFPKSGENALNPEVSVEAGTEPPKKKVDSNVRVRLKVKKTRTELQFSFGEKRKSTPYGRAKLKLNRKPIRHNN